MSLVWNHRHFQDRALWLWTELAKHYKGNKWIAGYNPLNEPTDSKHTRVIKFYDEVHAAIRAQDPDHIIFFDGNTFASDFSHFGDSHKNWDNTAYSIHDYSVFGFPAAPENYTGTPEQQRRLRRSYEKKREWMDERGLCVWNGEWGPVYARKQYDGAATDSINEGRYKVLSDQLDIYTKVRISYHPRIKKHLLISFTGSFELVHLVIQRHRIPRNGSHFPRYSLHATLQRFPRQKTSSRN